MARKVLFIVFLISLLVGFFYFKPLFGKIAEEPHLADRMPSGDFLGKVYLLDVARESTAMLFYNKVAMRDFFSHEFILAQSKSYGLNLQKPAYFFANSSGEWGALVEVNDSSKINSGIERLRKTINLQDTMVSDQRVYVLKEEKVYLAYGKKWFFIYKGNQVPKRLYHVKFAERNDISKSWRAFLNERQFRKEKLIVYSNSKKLREHGIQTAIFAHDSDSTSVSIKTYIRNSKPLKVAMKKPGMGFTDKTGTDKLLNVHLDIRKLRKDKNDPLYKWLIKTGRKVSFPTEAFMNAWDGDLSFYQGGMVKITETFIESVLDDDFNVSEVRTSQEKSVPGFAFMMSTNEHQKELISKLFSKGIMRKEGKKFYVLTSPPLHIRIAPDHLYLYSSDTPPATEISSSNSGVWVDKGTRYGFSLDSLNKHEVFGTVTIPVKSLMRKTKLL